MRFGLLKKQVITSGGQMLGYVKDVEAVWPDFRVVSIVVGRGLGGFGGKLIISVDAVVRIEKDAIIVEDGAVTEIAAEKASSAKLVQGTAASQTMTRE